MNREDALTIVRHYVKNENLINHMLAVESAMAFYARKLDPFDKIPLRKYENYQDR